MILMIQGEIGQSTASDFIKSMQDEPLEVHIDSIGGDLFAGLKIYNALKNHAHEVEVVVDGLAGSVASVIALAGDKRTISSTGSFMIHNALAPQTSGNHNDLRKVANTLEQYSQIVAKVYADNTKLSFDEALQLMNEETTFKAEDAIELGFVNSIIEPLKAVAKINHIDMSLLENIKKGLKLEAPVETPTIENEEATTEETATALSEEMKAEVVAIIEQMIAEALAGNTEEVGATIATVLNSIVSEGKAPQGTGIPAVENKTPEDGVSAFYKHMKEIKSKSKA